MDRPYARYLPGRTALAVVSLVVLCGLICSLTWSGAGLASERESTSSWPPCVTPEGLSPRGAEILCEVGEPAQTSLGYRASGATPVPERDTPDDDPLDGPVRKKRPADPDNATRLSIIQSGRQKDTPNSTALYDGDEETAWVPRDVEEPWVWVDLGDTATVRNVRWLANGSGDVELAISTDRKRWSVLDTVPIANGWHEITLREDARYVRLTLLPDDVSSPVELAEVEVFGRERKADVSLAQKAKKENKRKKKQEKRQERRRAAERAQDASASDEPANDTSRSDNGSSIKSSAKAGKTKCKGKRERCRAKPGRVEVTDDCGGNGTCTIDIRADGGSAVCDASGADNDRAGNGEGKRGGGNGGRCEAVANGGTVTIGDVNP